MYFAVCEDSFLLQLHSVFQLDSALTQGLSVKSAIAGTEGDLAP